jgi:lipoate---protein ligase
MTGFGDLEWEILPPRPFGAHLQMALDELILGQVATGSRPPTLRFWEWEERALVLGSHQVVGNEIDLDEAHARGFALTRRMSGGGTMILEPRRSITYSIYAPEALVARLSYVESFAFLDAWVVECLRALGVPASYRPINDIVSPEGKIGGAAQARRRRTVLHHTAIAFDMDPGVVPRLIRIGRDRVSPIGVRSAEKKVSPLCRWLDLDRDQAVELLAAWFSSRFPSGPGELTAADLESARDLAASKYATPGWIDRLGS